jgi:hypothetical protein
MQTTPEEDGDSPVYWLQLMDEHDNRLLSNVSSSSGPQFKIRPPSMPIGSRLRIRLFAVNRHGQSATLTLSANTLMASKWRAGKSSLYPFLCTRKTYPNSFHILHFASASDDTKANQLDKIIYLAFIVIASLTAIFGTFVVFITRCIRKRKPNLNSTSTNSFLVNPD